MAAELTKPEKVGLVQLAHSVNASALDFQHILENTMKSSDVKPDSEASPPPVNPLDEVKDILRSIQGTIETMHKFFCQEVEAKL